MSIIGLGTATFIPGYGLAAAAEAPGAAIVRRALDRGVDYVDTASVYADAERTVGAVLAEMAPRQPRIATKIAVAPRASVDEVGHLASAYLARLCLPGVDTILLHSASSRHLTDRGLAEGLRTLRRDGTARRTGASTYGADDASIALEQDWCDVIQIEHSILNQSVMCAVGPRKRAGQEIVARSVLCKGLLTGRQAHAPAMPANLGETLAAIEALAVEWKFTVPALAIRFALDTPAVDVVVVGVSSLGELDEALDAAGRQPLTPAQMATLASLDRSQLDAVHPERWPSLTR